MVFQFLRFFFFKNEMSLSGNLEKWTNYWLGWQSRYFKLENGILSYYQNEEEVDSGAKASLKVSSCDIVPDIVDNRKFDVTVGSGKIMIHNLRRD